MFRLQAQTIKDPSLLPFPSHSTISFSLCSLFTKAKTNQSLPKVDFPNGFSLSINKTHYSNEEEALKFIDEIILPHVQKERTNRRCGNQKVLLIFDVFRGQTTDKIFKVLKDNHILVTKVPANMTHLFHPLDLTVEKAQRITQSRSSQIGLPVRSTQVWKMARN